MASFSSQSSKKLAAFFNSSFGACPYLMLCFFMISSTVSKGCFFDFLRGFALLVCFVCLLMMSSSGAGTSGITRSSIDSCFWSFALATDWPFYLWKGLDLGLSLPGVVSGFRSKLVKFDW